MAKLRIKYDPNNKEIQIIEQQFRQKDINHGESEFTASNGFTLKSNSCPEISSDGLWLRGSDISMDDNILKIPNEKWLAKLRVAVKEYNKPLPHEIIE